jgi:hypothetical protein
MMRRRSISMSMPESSDFSSMGGAIRSRSLTMGNGSRSDRTVRFAAGSRDGEVMSPPQLATRDS